MPPFRAALLLLPLALAGCAPRPPAAPPMPPAPPVPAAPAVDAFSLPELPAAAPIAPAEYAARRAALVRHMGDGVLVAPGEAEPAADYLPYAQSSPFRYLTGITEPGAALVIVKRGADVEERLFVRARNPAREIWEGARLGAAGAEARTGIPSRTVDALLPVLDSVLPTAGTLYTLTPLPAAEPLAVATGEEQVLRSLLARQPGLRVVPLEDELLRIRAAKSPAELERIRRAVYITVLAHRAAMRAAEPGMNEFELQALIEQTFRRYGAERPAFASIVGSGPNATTLHYRAADRFMEPGDMLVMDIGASYRGYAADVTRSIPVSGRFSPEQRAIYQIVLAAQRAAEEAVRPGATWQELNRIAEGVIAEGLAELGLIDSPTATYRCESERFGAVCPQYRLFYMHGLGHGIGLDVHDPDLSYYEPFGVGSAFTIEPGIYVRADALDFLPDTPENRALAERLRPVVRRYQHIGVRIEDDYVITPMGVEHLSAGAPREIDELEALMALPAPGPAERRPELLEWYRQTEPR